MNRLDRSAKTPLYRQLAEVFRERISSGDWKEGIPIPSSPELAKSLETQVAVVERALQTLLLEGLISIKPGRGLVPLTPTSSARPVLAWDPGSGRLDLGGSVEIRVLSKVLTTLPKNLLSVFEVHGKEGHRANRIVKLRLVSGKPMVVETIYSPTSRLPGFLMKDHRQVDLYQMLVSQYRCEVVRVEQRSRVYAITSAESSILETEVGFPSLCVERVYFAGEGPLATSQWIVPAGRCGLFEEASALSV